MTDDELHELLMESLAMANNYICTGQINKAIPLLTQVKTIDPDNEIAAVMFGNVFGSQVGQDKVDLTEHFGKEWCGEDLAGKSIEVFSDQGMGDLIQLLRFLPSMNWPDPEPTDRRIIVNCYAHHRSLKRLMERVEFVDEFTDRHVKCDYHTNLMSVPSIICQVERNVQYPVGWTDIWFCPDSVDFGIFNTMWMDDGPKVGIAWHSNLDNPLGQLKSVPLNDIAMLENGRIQLFSLLPEEERYNMMVQLPIHDLEDTAKIIWNMDVVVSVDTAVLHLAGSLGKKTLALLPLDADPRWGNADTTCWYPNMELFRQVKENDWKEPIRRVKERLEVLTGNG